MQLYCRCGYPFHTTISSSGDEPYLILRDGRRGLNSPPIIRCPQCDQDLALEKLEQQAPPVELWHAEPELALRASGIGGARHTVMQ